MFLLRLIVDDTTRMRAKDFRLRALRHPNPQYYLNEKRRLHHTLRSRLALRIAMSDLRRSQSA